MEWENNSIPILERLSPIEEETEPGDEWEKLEKEGQEIDKEVHAQLGQIPDMLEQRIANYRRNLE